jgi:hypothetical protein
MNHWPGDTLSICEPFSVEDPQLTAAMFHHGSRKLGIAPNTRGGSPPTRIAANSWVTEIVSVSAGVLATR